MPTGVASPFRIAGKSGGVNEPGAIPSPKPPKMPSPSDVKENYDAQVKAFQDSIPQMKNSAYEGALNVSRGDLANRLADVKGSANSRGLLYGGLHEGGQQMATAQAAGDLARKKYDINSAFEQQGDQINQQQLDRLLEAYRSDVQEAQNQYSMNQQRSASQRGLFGQLAGAGITGGAIIAASDERLKKNSDGDVERQVDELLESIDPKTYEYKDGDKFGEGRHLSPMAQDLEKSEIGKSMVEDTPEGKMVNYGKGFGAIMATQAALNSRLKKLEAKG